MPLDPIRRRRRAKRRSEKTSCEIVVVTLWRGQYKMLGFFYTAAPEGAALRPAVYRGVRCSLRCGSVDESRCDHRSRRALLESGTSQRLPTHGLTRRRPCRQRRRVITVGRSPQNVTETTVTAVVGNIVVFRASRNFQRRGKLRLSHECFKELRFSTDFVRTVVVSAAGIIKYETFISRAPVDFPT